MERSASAASTASGSGKMPATVRELLEQKNEQLSEVCNALADAKATASMCWRAAEERLQTVKHFEAREEARRLLLAAAKHPAGDVFLGACEEATVSLSAPNFGAKLSHLSLPSVREANEALAESPRLHATSPSLCDVEVQVSEQKPQSEGQRSSQPLPLAAPANAPIADSRLDAIENRLEETARRLEVVLQEAVRSRAFQPELKGDVPAAPKEELLGAAVLIRGLLAPHMEPSARVLQAQAMKQLKANLVSHKALLCLQRKARTFLAQVEVSCRQEWQCLAERARLAAAAAQAELQKEQEALSIARATLDVNLQPSSASEDFARSVKLKLAELGELDDFTPGEVAAVTAALLGGHRERPRCVPALNMDYVKFGDLYEEEEEPAEKKTMLPAQWQAKKRNLSQEAKRRPVSSSKPRVRPGSVIRAHVLERPVVRAASAGGIRPTGNTPSAMKVRPASSKFSRLPVQQEQRQETKEVLPRSAPFESELPAPEGSKSQPQEPQELQEPQQELQELHAVADAALLELHLRTEPLLEKPQDQQQFPDTLQSKQAGHLEQLEQNFVARKNAELQRTSEKLEEFNERTLPRPKRRVQSGKRSRTTTSPNKRFLEQEPRPCSAEKLLYATVALATSFWPPCSEAARGGLHRSRPVSGDSLEGQGHFVFPLRPSQLQAKGMLQLNG